MTRTGRKGHIGRMSASTDLNLEQIGHDAAAEVAGAENVGAVEAVEGVDWADGPSYFFVFMIDKNKDGLRPGELKMRLGLRLRDALIAQGDFKFPYIRILPREAWAKRGRAWSH